MVGSPETAPEVDATAERVLDAAFPEGPVGLVGGGERAGRLIALRPERYRSLDGVATAPDTCTVVALDAAEATLRQARDAARALGAHSVCVLFDVDEELVDRSAIRERLHREGLAVAGTNRLLWKRVDRVSPPSGTRAERLEAETRIALFRCVLADDPRALGELEAALEQSQRELDLYRQLEVDHARTREAEREREARLQELETRMQLVGDVGLGSEVERLTKEIETMRATRVWRLGERWWSAKERLRRSGS